MNVPFMSRRTTSNWSRNRTIGVPGLAAIPQLDDPGPDQLPHQRHRQRLAGSEPYRARRGAVRLELFGMGADHRRAHGVEAAMAPSRLVAHQRSSIQAKRRHSVADGVLRSRGRGLDVPAEPLEGPPRVGGKGSEVGQHPFPLLHLLKGTGFSYPHSDHLALRPRTAPAIIRLTAASESPPSSRPGIVAKPIAEALG